MPRLAVLICAKPGLIADADRRSDGPRPGEVVLRRQPSRLSYQRLANETARSGRLLLLDPKQQSVQSDLEPSLYAERVATQRSRDTGGRSGSPDRRRLRRRRFYGCSV